MDSAGNSIPWEQDRHRYFGDAYAGPSENREARPIERRGREAAEDQFFAGYMISVPERLVRITAAGGYGRLPDSFRARSDWRRFFRS